MFSCAVCTCKLQPTMKARSQRWYTQDFIKKNKKIECSFWLKQQSFKSYQTAGRYAGNTLVSSKTANLWCPVCSSGTLTRSGRLGPTLSVPSLPGSFLLLCFKLPPLQTQMTQINFAGQLCFLRNNLKAPLVGPESNGSHEFCFQDNNNGHFYEHDP